MIHQPPYLQYQKRKGKHQIIRGLKVKLTCCNVTNRCKVTYNKNVSASANQKASIFTPSNLSAFSFKYM